MQVVRVGDICTGHGCFPPRSVIAGSTDVFVEGISAIRIGDPWESHTCVSTHDGVQASGSSTVFVNGVPLARIGDVVSCGSSAATGSDTVFAG